MKNILHKYFFLSHHCFTILLDVMRTKLIYGKNFIFVQVWKMYRESTPEGEKTVALSTFRKLWKQLLPYVVITKPATDLCWICQKNNNLIIKQVSKVTNLLLYILFTRAHS